MPNVYTSSVESRTRGTDIYCNLERK